MSVFLLVSIANSSFAAIEVFTQYDTTMIFNSNNTIDVHKEILLRNIHEVGIVPGQIEFKINGKSEGLELLDYEVIDRYGREIRSSLVQTGDTYTIMLNIFSPILPGFDYKIDLKYSLAYEPAGIFFKRVEVPLKENTRIPILRGNVELLFPEKYSVTYTDYTDNNTTIHANTAIWDLDKNSPETVMVEYSYIPLSIGGVSGALIFWIVVNIILLVLLVWQIKKEVLKFKENNA